jgi:endo-1,4-beta-xylanase
MNNRMNRRQMLQLSTAAALLRSGPTLAAEPGLGDVAAANGILYGANARGAYLASDAAYARMYATECKLIVGALEMHWDIVEPKQGRDDFRKADAIQSWAAEHNIKFRGHTLVWGERLPEWFEKLPDRKSAESALVRHIRTVCSHFAGKMHSWDVVNEAIKSNDGREDGLRVTPMIEKIGPEYLDIAFSTAREADPKALLVYNDFDFEYTYPDNYRRQRILLGMVDGFKKRGTPIDAIGLHSHLLLEDRPKFDERKYASFLREIADRGLQIIISELDVGDKSAPADIARRDAEVASMYKQFLDVALSELAVKTVINWGLTDHDSWIVQGAKSVYRRTDSAKPRPLPFDDDYAKKPAYYAILDALKAAKPR